MGGPGGGRPRGMGGVQEGTPPNFVSVSEVSQRLPVVLDGNPTLVALFALSA